MSTLRSRPEHPATQPVSVVTARQRVIGAFAALGMLALLVGVPFLLLAAHRTLWPVLSWADLRLRLAAPDDGSLLAVALTVVLWVAWAWLALTVLIELVAALRRVPSPHLPGLPQAFASRLVAAALTFATLPTVAQATNAPAAAVVRSVEVPTGGDRMDTGSPVHKPKIRELPGEPVLEVPASTQQAGPSDAQFELPRSSENTRDAAESQAAKLVDYVVRPNDTLWRIARERLGDPRRWTEIADLNPDLADPDFLDVRMVLRVPASPAIRSDGALTTGSTTYEVEQGDTLSQVALDELGDAGRYPEIAASSSNTVQPDGSRLSNPDHIEPGWTLTIPSAAGEKSTMEASDASFVEEPLPAGANEAQIQADATASPEPAELTNPGRGPRTAIGQERPVERPADDTSAPTMAQATPSWLLPGLTGAGALLAACLFAAFRRNRAMQWRYRRPGRLVAPVPPQAVPAERTAVVHGSKVVPDVERLDLLLKALGGPYLEPGTAPRPPVVAVELTPSDAVVHLAEPQELHAPWTGEGVRWSAALSGADENVRGELNPYPLLVTVGQDAEGHMWLLDLERARRVFVTGDDEAALAFGRAVAAELNLCPWACNTTTHTLGFAHEAADLSEVRGHAHREPDPDCLRSTVLGAVNDSSSLPGEDREWFHLVLTDPSHADEVAEIRDALFSGSAARAGAAVVQCGGLPTEGDLEIAVGHGRLQIESLGLDLAGVGLTQSELDASVALVVATDSLDDVEAPALTDGVLSDVADVTGALLPEVTEPRPEDPGEPAGAGSLLPAPASGYVEAAATVGDDVERLAPVIPPETTERVLSADEQLNRDVEDWFGESVPRLMVLGPVTARARKPRRAEKKWPQILSTLTYLMHHPDGAGAPEIAETLGEAGPKIRTYVSYLRAWFGNDPRTGHPHAPKANESRAHEERGVQCYQVEGVLYDVDLFRRLRARGQARGADGIADLVTALRLVRGRPFQGVETQSVWQWVFEGERVDLELTAAIVDVAHIIADHGFASGDLDLVGAAVAAAKLVAPDDDVVVNDEAHLLWKQGHTDLARRRQQGLLDGADDGSDLGPVDAPERTRAIAAQGQRSRRS